MILTLADFQRMHKLRNKIVLLDGLSQEYTKSFSTQDNEDYANVKTEFFALRLAIHFIIMGYELFLELDSNENNKEIECQFQNVQLLVGLSIYVKITSKCWTQEYNSTQEIVNNILIVQKKRGLHIIINTEIS